MVVFIDESQDAERFVLGAIATLDMLTVKVLLGICGRRPGGYALACMNFTKPIFIAITPDCSPVA